MLNPINAFISFLLGGLGWGLFAFVGQPLRQFFDLRREIKRRMLLHYDEPSPSHSLDILDYHHEQRGIRESFAELSAQMIAFDRSETIAAWIARQMGFDAIEAGRALWRLSNDFGLLGEDRDKNFERVDRSLKFRIATGKVFYDPKA